MCEINNERVLNKRGYKKLLNIDKKLKEVEIENAKIKAVNFLNLQTFDEVYKNYDVGEVYDVNGVGYTIITSKTDKQINFVTIMPLHNVWDNHLQDVDKVLDIQQGIYYDLINNIEYKDEVFVGAYETSRFQARGNIDLIMKGKIYR